MRQRGLKLHPLACGGMSKCQGARVQRLAWQDLETIFHEMLVFREGSALEDPIAPIGLITEQWVLYVLEVHAYLVRAAGFQLAVHQCDVTEPLHHGIMCHRMPAGAAIRVHRKYLTVAGTASDMARDGAGVLLQVAPYQRHIMPVDGMVEELCRHPGLRELILANDHDSGGVLVDAMHQERQPSRLFVGRDILEMVSQGIHQRAGVVAVGWMNHHAGLFVNDQDICIFIDDLHRNIFGDDLNLPGWMRKHHRDDIIGMNAVIRLDGLVIDEDVTSMGSLLYLVPGGILQPYHQELVNTQQTLALIGHNAVMFVKVLVFLQHLQAFKVFREVGRHRLFFEELGIRDDIAGKVRYPNNV